MMMKKSMPPYKIDVKFLEIIVNLVREQNEQLLIIISENENLSKRDLAAFIPSKFALKDMMLALLNGQEPPLTM